MSAVERPTDGPDSGPGVETSTRWAVDVNELKVSFTGSPETRRRWFEYRKAQPDARITVLSSCMGGDQLRIACDSKGDADWLAAHLVAHVGLASTAVTSVTIRPVLCTPATRGANR